MMAHKPGSPYGMTVPSNALDYGSRIHRNLLASVCYLNIEWRLVVLEFLQWFLPEANKGRQ